MLVGVEVVVVLAAAIVAPPAQRGYDGPDSVAGPTPEITEPATRPPSDPPAPIPEPVARPKAEAPDSADDRLQRTVRVTPRNPPRVEEDRSGSVVTREQLRERLPRSAPDALRDEPGVYIQQTAHSQASPYVRGLTGQQTVMFFDGVRLNNATFRQGPNQYFFTIDSQTIDSLEVVRGSASTRYGSDAMGGALLTTPIEPSFKPMDRPGRSVWSVHPRAIMRTATADGEIGGRAQLDVAYGDKVGVIGGVGYRDLGNLRSGGRITAPATGLPQNVPPVFADDGKTQLGTGFEELTADVRVVWRPRKRLRFTLGYYDYRQFDAPRTDRCPPPTAPSDECLRYLEQFRTLVYGAFGLEEGPKAAENLRVTLSYQNQHERRELQRGSPSTTQVNGRDDVHSLGTSLRIATHEFELGRAVDLKVLYGADLYYDRIDSRGWLFFGDTNITSFLSRGQYLDDANYLTSGLWTEVQTRAWRIVRFRLGGRGALVHAQADGDPQSESAAVDRTWGTAVANAGISVDAVPWLRFMFNVDQGFRAPNLDDLTSRQQTGPGFQFENADLGPERSVSLELGTRVRNRFIELQGWVFQNFIHDLIARAPRTLADCPQNDPGCGASQTRFQLVNLDDRAVIRGVEGDLRLYLPVDLAARATVSLTWGSGPNPVDPDAPGVPLSRIPPLNGLAELGWRPQKWGFHLVGALRWARRQDRLALADIADVRIPDGGTPGYVVFDLRAGYRFDPFVALGLVFENIGDAAYRTHGSSVNGPGRGLITQLEVGF